MGAVARYNPPFEDVRKQYGAAGNGVADDTAKLQAACDAVAAGGEVLLPAGDYRTTGFVDVAANTKITGSPGSHIHGYGFRCESGAKISGITFTGDLTNPVHAITTDPVATTDYVWVTDCTFNDYAQAIYIDRGDSVGTCDSWKISNNSFLGCVAGIFAVRGNKHLISGNTFVTAQSQAQHILYWGGSLNRVVNNHMRWGKTGVLFLFHRSYNGPGGIFKGNVIANNVVTHCSEEHISFDVNGNTAADVAVFEKDTVASKSSSGGYKVTLTNAGWSSAAAAYVGYYLCFNTGGLAGQVAEITAQSNATMTLDITAAQYASIAASDAVVVGAPAFANVITGNYVDDGGRGTTSSITLYGLAYANTVAGNTCVGSPLVVTGLNSLIKASPNYTDTFGMAPCEGNTIVGNTVVQSDIDLGYNDFGVSPTYTQHGNVVGLNSISGGSLLLSNQNIVEVIS